MSEQEQARQETRNEQEFREWKTQPVTENFFKLLKKSRQETMEQWAGKTFLTVEQNAYALGGINAIEQILEMDAQSLNEGLRDE